ncbi:MAG: PIN domain-containing protein [Candidatus Omnitrophica bacterium]|nr:PIN domain-containing protein [Candidatus Omnitrophota bacterium]
MATNIKKFSDFASNTSCSPDKIYCDTNFVLFLHGNISGDTKNKYKYQEHLKFWQKLSDNNVSLFVSTLVINEAIFINFYKLGLHKEIQAFLKLSNNDTLPTIKTFRKKHPDEYNLFYKKHIHRVKDLLQFLYNTDFIILPTFPSCIYDGKIVSQYTENLLEKNHKLDVSDALQIAIASYLGIDTIATTDPDFWEVDNITVYSPDYMFH